MGSSLATSGDLSIGTGDTGVRFSDSTDSIYPISSTTGFSRDAAVDIGYSTVRFKDLYLSGGVYLGGTSAANKLDDYEEGTWTPTISLGGFSGINGTGYYTKIGRSVHIQWEGNISGTGDSNYLKIGGLPFSAVDWAAGSMYAQYYNQEGSKMITPAVRSGQAIICLIYKSEAADEKER